MSTRWSALVTQPPASDRAADITPAAVPAATEPAADLHATAHQVAIGELRRLLALWRRHEPGARLGEDPETLHQLRVTTRRIDAVLSLFRRQLPPPLVRARKTTKAVLRSLGAARDLDVELGELAEYCAQLPQAERVAAEPLTLLLERERARARARMLRSLDSEPTRRWLETLASAGGAGNETSGDDCAAVVMPEHVRRRFRKLRKSVGKLRGKSSMEDYHRVRRRAKQLRYATECGAALFGKPADELLRALRRLQDRLGAHQDSYLAQKRLAALAADPASDLPPATLFLMGRLAEHHQQLTGQARRTVTRSWRRVRGKRWKALRARLGELSDGALAANGVSAPLGAVLETAVQPRAGSAAQVPAVPEARPLRH